MCTFIKVKAIKLARDIQLRAVVLSTRDGGTLVLSPLNFAPYSVNVKCLWMVSFKKKNTLGALFCLLFFKLDIIVDPNCGFNDENKV